MISQSIATNDVNENQYIELTHYLSYVFVYYVLQITCLITVCIHYNQLTREKKNAKTIIRIRSFVFVCIYSQVEIMDS